MGVLKYVSQVFGEQFAVMLSGIILMLVLFAGNWDFLNMVYLMLKLFYYRIHLIIIYTIQVHLQLQTHIMI